MAAADIARIAGVGRAAVSNWRRRFPDFPAPVGGSAASPLFSLADVESWFERNGREFPVRPSDRVWQLIRGTVDDLQIRDLVGYLGMFLVFLRRQPRAWRKLAGRPDEDVAVRLSDAISAAVPEAPEPPDRIDAQWVEIARAVAEVVREEPPADLFDFLFDRYAEAHSRRLPVTPGPVAELMVRLAGVEGADVLDPACGTGTLLLAARNAGAARLLGQDVDAGAVRLAASRLLLRGAPAGVAVGDSLREDGFGDLRVRVVVCNPPFGERAWGYDELANDPRWEYGLPPRGEPELAWVQHCLAHLEPGGHAVVMMPSGAASRRAGRRIRSNLLRSGVLRGVVSLPAGAVPPGGDLWLLRRPAPGDPSPSHLLVADGEELSAVPATWRSYLADPEAQPSGRSRTLRIIDLLDEEVDVSPARHLAGPAGPGAEEFAHLRDRIRAGAARLAESMPDLVVDGVPEPMPMTTLGELVKAGVVSTHQAPLKTRTDEGEIPVLTLKDVEIGRAPSGWGSPETGMVHLEPGDVVMPTAPQSFAVRVITDEAGVLGPRLTLFRPDPQRLDPYLLACFFRVSWIHGAARGSVVGSLRRIEIPLLPLPAQQAYGRAFQRLTAFEDEARRIAERSEKLVRLALAGLADGSLHPAAEPDGQDAE